MKIKEAFTEAKSSLIPSLGVAESDGKSILMDTIATTVFMFF